MGKKKSAEEEKKLFAQETQPIAKRGLFLFTLSDQSPCEGRCLSYWTSLFHVENYQFPSLFSHRSLASLKLFISFSSLLQLSTQFAVASFIVEQENCLQLNYNDFVRHRETK